MKKVFGALAFIVLASGSARADGFHMDMNAWGTYVHPTTQTTTDDASGIQIRFRDGGGGGLTHDARLIPLLSVECGVFFTRQTGAITVQGQKLVDLGHLDTIPIVLGVKLHPLGTAFFDPYVGGGGAYMVFENLHGPQMDAAGIGVVTIKNKFAFMANAGVRIGSGRFGFLVDARYIPVKPESRGPTGDPVDLKLNPILVSAGVGVRF
jgi:outer membrane protein W